jgi:hypothetical protein
MLDGVKLGVATLDSYGSAVLTTTYLPVGVHSITAIYSGDGNMTGSTSAPFTQTVLSAQQELLLIADQVNNMVQNDTLNSGVGQALISELDNAIAILNTGNTTAGINKLDALLNRTQALVRTGQLDGYDAEVLIEEIDLAIAAALATQS